MAFQLLTLAQAKARGESVAAGTGDRWRPLAGLDPGDFTMLEQSDRLIGTVSGGAVTAVGGGTPLRINVAASVVSLGPDNPSASYGSTNLDVPSGSGATQDRFYLVTNTGALGTPALVQGTLADQISDTQPGPSYPAVTTNVYAVIFVPGGTTTITASHIVDKRIAPADPAMRVIKLNTGGDVNYARPANFTGSVIWQHSGGTQPNNLDPARDVWPGASTASVPADQQVRSVNTGGVVGTARPAGIGTVIWRHNGATQPTNMIDAQDIWIPA